MKKHYFIIAAVFHLILFFTSCKKNVGNLDSGIAGIHKFNGEEYSQLLDSAGTITTDSVSMSFLDTVTVFSSTKIALQAGMINGTYVYDTLYSVASNNNTKTISFVGNFTMYPTNNTDSVVYNYSTNSIFWYRYGIVSFGNYEWYLHSP